MPHGDGLAQVLHLFLHTTKTLYPFGEQNSIKKDHAEKRNLTLGAKIHEPAFIRQIFDVNTVGGQAGKAKVRIAAGFFLQDGTAFTEVASAGACQKAVDPGGTKVLHQPDGGGIVALFLHDGWRQHRRRWHPEKELLCERPCNHGTEVVSVRC